MQPACGGVGTPAELAARVQPGHDDLDARQPGLGLDVHRDAPALVADLDEPSAWSRTSMWAAEAPEGLVDRVVDDLPDAVHEAAGVGRPDVHARALADGLQPLEDGQVPGGVVGRG